MPSIRHLKQFLRPALVAGALLTVGAGWTRPATSVGMRARATAVVSLKEVGIVYPTPGDSAAPVRIIVYATGPARVGVGEAGLAPLTDTLRLTSMQPLAADVSEADVHIRLLSPGRLRVAGDVTGGRVIGLTATGRHIVLLRGGVGARTITDPE